MNQQSHNRKYSYVSGGSWGREPLPRGVPICGRAGHEFLDAASERSGPLGASWCLLEPKFKNVSPADGFDLLGRPTRLQAGQAGCKQGPKTVGQSPSRPISVQAVLRLLEPLGAEIRKPYVGRPKPTQTGPNQS